MLQLGISIWAFQRPPVPTHLSPSEPFHSSSVKVRISLFAPSKGGELSSSPNAVKPDPVRAACFLNSRSVRSDLFYMDEAPDSSW